jgi:hypothetical protein
MFSENRTGIPCIEVEMLQVQRGKECVKYLNKTVYVLLIFANLKGNVFNL